MRPAMTVRDAATAAKALNQEPRSLSRCPGTGIHAPEPRPGAFHAAGRPDQAVFFCTQSLRIIM
jgi:hypothetical protein